MSRVLSSIPGELVDSSSLQSFYRSRFLGIAAELIPAARGVESVATFVRQMHRMIAKSGYITDLAGNGNLLMTRSGEIKLVDINNIIKVSSDQSIPLDDKGYPPWDKSIEVLAILEDKTEGQRS